MERFKTLEKAYKFAAKNNRVYEETQSSIQGIEKQIQYLESLSGAVKILTALIVEQEEQWQRNILDTFEDEIREDLSFVFPEDGYSVNLSSRVLRGKIHIDAYASSYFAGAMRGEISETQGRLFQQVVSFAALVCIMKIMGVNTIYVDEAFSGVATENISKVNALLASLSERGYNIILIAQNMDMAANLYANVLTLSRSLDNQTTVKTQRKVSNSGY